MTSPVSLEIGQCLDHRLRLSEQDDLVVLDSLVRQNAERLQNPFRVLRCGPLPVASAYLKELVRNAHFQGTPRSLEPDAGREPPGACSKILPKCQGV